MRSLISGLSRWAGEKDSAAPSSVQSELRRRKPHQHKRAFITQDM